MRSGQIVRRPGVARAFGPSSPRAETGSTWASSERDCWRSEAPSTKRPDLERRLADWVEPLKARVFGHDIWTVPPNSQGYLSLLGCAIAEGLDLPDDPADPVWAHLLIESARAAAYDRPSVLYEGADVSGLFEPDEVDRRRRMIRADRCSQLAVPTAGWGHDVSLCGRLGRERVSLIQSNASGYGCHVFEPRTGIGLHNRGIGFSLAAGHPAEYGPGRRPPHTLAPSSVTRPDGTLRAVVGTMGGDAQPQILLQILVRWLHHGQDPAARDRVRSLHALGLGHSGFDTWTDPDGVRVELEEDGPDRWPDGLRDLGHEVNAVSGLQAPSVTLT